MRSIRPFPDRNSARVALVGACTGALLALSACHTAPVNERGVPVQRAPIMAEYGTVQGVTLVPVASRPSGAGVVLGAVLGAVIGNQFGKGSGRALTTIGGAVGGGVAGNAIEERSRTHDEVYRVTVRMDNGVFRDFDFHEIYNLRAGDRVRVEGGQLHRL